MSAQQPARGLKPLEFSIATCWSETLLEHLSSLNRAHPGGRFAEIFGAHQINITGGGRPAYRLPEVSREAFEQHVCSARRHGLRFNYVMNAPGFGGRETDPAWWQAVARHLEYLATCQVSGITAAHPKLLRFIRSEFPKLRTNVSLIAGVDTVAAAKEFEDLGVDVINLNPFTINRDFDALAAIRSAVRCELELYANIPCLDHCPNRKAHYEFSGRASQQTGAPQIRQDPFLMRCSERFLSAPVEFLRSPYIRPEDVSIYHEIGIDVLKFSDRTESAEFLSNTASAYAAGRYEGNLFDLIFRSGRKIRSGLGFVEPGSSVRAINVMIENRVLNEFNFIQQIRKLRGRELEAFYQRAAAHAVRYAEPAMIAGWRETLQAGINSFDLRAASASNSPVSSR